MRPRYVTLTEREASMALSFLAVNGRNSCPLCQVNKAKCDRAVVESVGFWNMTADSLAACIRVVKRAVP